MAAVASKVCAIVGAGPGLGAGLARVFAKAGYDIALIGRKTTNLEPLAAEVDALGRKSLCVPSDATDAASVAQACAAIEAGLGVPDVFIYNVAMFKWPPASSFETPTDDFVAYWQTLCLGGIHWSKALGPQMVKAGRGSMLFSGATASVRANANFGAFASAKHALRAFVHSLAREVQPKGVHVAHVLLDGVIGGGARDGAGKIDPDECAQVYLDLHNQKRSTWTLELDTRPMTEEF